MVLMFEKIFGPRIREDEPEDDEVDPVVAREYDAHLVEFGLLTEGEFNLQWPNAPFLSEEEMDALAAAGIERPFDAALREEKSS